MRYPARLEICIIIGLTNRQASRFGIYCLWRRRFRFHMVPCKCAFPSNQTVHLISQPHMTRTPSHLFHQHEPISIYPSQPILYINPRPIS